MRFLSHYLFLSQGFQTAFPAVLNIQSKWALTGVFITTSTTPWCCFPEHSFIKIPPDFNQSPQAIMKSCRWHVYLKYNLFQFGPILIKASQGEMGLLEPSWLCVFETPRSMMDCAWPGDAAQGSKGVPSLFLYLFQSVSPSEMLDSVFKKTQRKRQTHTECEEDLHTNCKIQIYMWVS